MPKDKTPYDEFAYWGALTAYRNAKESQQKNSAPSSQLNAAGLLFCRHAIARLLALAPNRFKAHVQAVTNAVNASLQGYPKKGPHLAEILMETLKLLKLDAKHPSGECGYTPQNIKDYIQLAEKTADKFPAIARVAAAMLALAGAVLIVACVMASPLTSGFSLLGIKFAIDLIAAGAGVAVGTAAIGVGAGLFFSGREKGLTKAMRNLAAQAATEQETAKKTQSSPPLGNNN